MGIPGELRLGASLALFAIAGLIFWRFRHYLTTEEWLRDFGPPPQAPRHVAILILIAIGFIVAGALFAPSPL
jgi:hypothetical protein